MKVFPLMKSPFRDEPFRDEPFQGRTEFLLMRARPLRSGPSYGDTLTWTPAFRPDVDVQLVHAQV